MYCCMVLAATLGLGADDNAKKQTTKTGSTVLHYIGHKGECSPGILGCKDLWGLVATFLQWLTCYTVLSNFTM